MQQAVNVIRATGATNPIAVAGPNYANDLSAFLANKPTDPVGGVMAAMDIYGNNACGTPACLDSTVAATAAAVPTVFGEYGETYDASSCSSTRTAANVGWADATTSGTWRGRGTRGVTAKA
jgi:endoglucanase